jgi:hypothetical protein
MTLLFSIHYHHTPFPILSSPPFLPPNLHHQIPKPPSPPPPPKETNPQPTLHQPSISTPNFFLSKTKKRFTISLKAIYLPRPSNLTYNYAKENPPNNQEITRISSSAPPHIDKIPK